MDCPLCLEEMDLSDLNFKPCPCGYQVSFHSPLALLSIHRGIDALDFPIDLSVLLPPHQGELEQSLSGLSNPLR